MKKARFLAIVLCFALLLTTVSGAFGSVVLAAQTAADLPVYDSTTQFYVKNIAQSWMSTTKTTYDIEGIKDHSEAVYSQITVQEGQQYYISSNNMVVLANTDSNLTKAAGDKGNFVNSQLVLWMPATGGFAIALLSSDVAADTAPSWAGDFYWEAHGSFVGYGGSYPNGSTNFPQNNSGAVVITTKLEDGKLSLWMTMNGTTNIILDEFKPSAYNFTSIAAGCAKYGTNLFSYKADVWTAKTNDVDYNPLPTYDSTTQAKVASVKGDNNGYMIATKTTYDIEGIKDNSEAVYSQITVQEGQQYYINDNNMVVLANTDSNLTKAAGDKGNFVNSQLVLWMPATGGFAIALLSSDVAADTQPSWAGDFYWEAHGSFAGYGGSYPNGSTNFPQNNSGAVVITTKLEDGKLSLWMTMNGTTNIILNRFEPTKYNFTSLAAGCADYGSSNIFSYKADVWTATENYVDPNAAPEFDAETQKEIVDIATYGPFGGATMSATEFRGLLADITKPVYISVNAYPTGASGNDHSVSVILAKADAEDVAAHNLSGNYAFGFRFMKAGGWSFGLFNTDNSASILTGGYYIKYDQNYANGTLNIDSDGVDVVAKYENGTLSVWLDGMKVLDKWSYTHATKPALAMVEPIVGGASYGAQYTLSNVSVWTEQANYGKLGDLDADFDVDVCDLVLAKLYNGGEDVAYNEAVVNFGEADMLAQIRKFLIGLIETVA